MRDDDDQEFPDEEDYEETSSGEWQEEQCSRDDACGELRLCAECGEPYDGELPESDLSWDSPVQYSQSSDTWCLSCHLGLDEESGGKPKLTGEPEWFLAESILDRLREKFGDFIPSRIRDVRIVQSAHTVWLEVTRAGKDSQDPDVVTIHREDLGYLVADDSGRPRFHPRRTVSMNASAFLEFDAIDICCLTTDLFPREARDRIMDEYAESADAAPETEPER